MSEPIYKDDTGKTVSLLALCRGNPEWAAARIRNMRDALEQSQEQIDSLQQRIHLCAGYDELEEKVEALETQLGLDVQRTGEG